MVKRTVRDHFYFAGAIRAPGDEIEIETQADLKTLEARGLVSGEASTAKAEAAAPSNKMEKAAPANKSAAKG